MRKPEYREEKTREIMEKCYECYCDNGLRDTGIKELGRYCGMTSANLYSYFPCVDDIIVKSTAHCMAQVEQEFMAKAPENIEELYRFIEEVPYWAAEKYGKKYRLMYQVYTHPKYIEYGKKFFEGVNERYTEYAQRLSPKLGISVMTIRGSNEPTVGLIPAGVYVSAVSSGSAAEKAVLSSSRRSSPEVKSGTPCISANNAKWAALAGGPTALLY